MKAIQVSDLSLAVPMVALTPFFLLLTSPLLVGEFPAPLGVVGIVLIVAGSYLMKVRERARGLLAPFRVTSGREGAEADDGGGPDLERDLQYRQDRTEKLIAPFLGETVTGPLAEGQRGVPPVSAKLSCVCCGGNLLMPCPVS